MSIYISCNRYGTIPLPKRNSLQFNPVPILHHDNHIPAMNPGTILICNFLYFRWTPMSSLPCLYGAISTSRIMHRSLK